MISAWIVAPRWLLPGKIGSHMIIHTIFFKSIITQITPENGCHPQPMRFLKSMRYFGNLSVRLLRTEINGCAYRRCPHDPCIFHWTIHYLIGLVGISEQFVVDLSWQWKEFCAHIFLIPSQARQSWMQQHCNHLLRRASQYLRIKIYRVGSKRCACTVLNAWSTGSIERYPVPAACLLKKMECRLRSVWLFLLDAAKTASTKSGEGRWSYLL